MFKLNFVKNQVFLLILVLAVVGFFIYSFNLNNKLFWDDENWIINNNFVHKIRWDNVKFWFTHNTLAGIGQKSNYYRPFLFFTFALNYSISGIKPLSYHLISNLIHIVNGLLVFGILYLVFRRKLLAFLTSLIFLIHPLQTEAITYVSGRGDALVAMFMFLGLLFFYKSQQNHSTRYFLLTISSLVLGLLSRETAIIFPFLVLAFYIAAISKEKFISSIRQGIIKTWPYFAVVLTYGILRLTVFNFQDTLNFYTEPNIYSEHLYIRMFTFLTILWEYLKLLVIPVGLHMERSSIVYTSLFQWPVWPMFLALIGLLIWLKHLYKNEIATFHIWFLGVALFFISLGPVSGITPINALIYEHWLYLPMVGFWLIVSFYLVKLFDYLKSRKPSFLYFLSLTFLIAYLSFFVYQAIQCNLLWGNPLNFYMNILKYEPNSSRINNNVGNFYYNQKDMANAEKYYRIATVQNDIFAEPYFNLGTILQFKGDVYGAVKLYEKAVEINPDFYYPYQNLSVIYAQQGNLIKAAESIEKLKLIVSENPRVYYNSALVYLALNNKTQALKDLQSGLKYSGTDPKTGELIKKLIGELQK